MGRRKERLLGTHFRRVRNDSFLRLKKERHYDSHMLAAAQVGFARALPLVRIRQV